MNPTPKTARRRRHRTMRLMTTALATLIIGYTAILIAGCTLQERLIFPRHFAANPTRDPEPPTERLWIAHDQDSHAVTPDKPEGENATEAWLRIAPGRSAENPGPVAMYFHGNGEIIEEVPSAVWDVYTDNAVSVAMLEYRGYANADGNPGQQAITRDARLLRDFLADHPAIDPERIIYHGRSIGGGVACSLANEQPPAAMVLDATFTSVPAVAAKYLMPAFLIRHPFRNQQTLRDAAWPVLLSHGTEDRIIPASHSRKLVETTPNATLHLYEGDGHNDIPRDRQRYNQRLLDFLKEAGIITNGPSPDPTAAAPTDDAP